MKIVEGKQLDLKNIEIEKIDLYLFAVNHELRCYTLYDALTSLNISIEKKLALCYSKTPDHLLRDNFDYFTPCIHNIEELSNLFEKLINQFVGRKEIQIVVDYSCMTKLWYYTFILFIAKKDLEFESIYVHFSYTPSKFSEPKPPKYNTEIEPIPGTYRIPTDKPKALIVCLGYEEKKAEGIIDYLDPKETFIFYSKPALDKEFEKKLLENNQGLLSKNYKVYTYPLNDLLYIERTLTSLYYSLRNSHSIIIAPLGPKPFTLVSMILSLKFSDIDIWRVGSGNDINEYTREPIENSFIINQIIFTKE